MPSPKTKPQAKSKPKKKPKFNFQTAVRGAIRRAFARSPKVRETLMKVRREVPKYNKDGTRAKRDAVQYLCAVCQEWVSSTKIEVDHIEPVIDPSVGFVDWNTYVERIDCDVDNLRPICTTCHKNKTAQERAVAVDRRRLEKQQNNK